MNTTNKVSIVINDESVSKILDAIKVIRENLPWLISLTPDDRHELPKMGNKSVSFVNRSFEYATQNPNIVPSFMDMPEFKKDVDVTNQLFKIAAPIQKLAEELDDTLMQAGSEAYTSALLFYSSLKVALKGGETGLKNIHDELSKRFPGRS